MMVSCLGVSTCSLPEGERIARERSKVCSVVAKDDEDRLESSLLRNSKHQTCQFLNSMSSVPKSDLNVALFFLKRQHSMFNDISLAIGRKLKGRADTLSFEHIAVNQREGRKQKHQRAIYARFVEMGLKQYSVLY